MNILLIGQAAENTATANLLRQSKRIINSIYCHGGCVSGNSVSRSLPVSSQATVSQIIKTATEHQVGLVILTTEQAVLSGIGNAFQSVRIPCFGPTTIAAHFRWDPGFVTELAGDIGIKTVTRTFHRNLGALNEALHERFGNDGVTIRAVRNDGRTRIFHCASLTQIANAVYVLESQPDLHQYSRFYIETYASGSRCTFAAMANGRNLIGIGTDSEIKAKIMDQVARPLLGVLCDAGAPYTGWLVAEMVVGKEDMYLSELHCMPRTDFLSSLSNRAGFDLLSSIMTVLESDLEPYRPQPLPAVRRFTVPPPPVRIPLPPR